MLTPGEWCPYCEMNATDDGFCACQIVSPATATPGKPLGLISAEDRQALHDQIAQLTAENERLLRVVEQALVFIECTAIDLHNRRCTDWYPEGAQNAASQMSEDMRLIGNAMIEAVAQLKGADRG